ncbi:MAG: class I SAM-dependent methyltransferase [Candidatus Sungbacteria bacterium]|uniref:Class I SAM-dependent methyltransferase n=1 Tax=Candidatus Sungiibacteriota bacterium TaxID=2750080 RepID=A0A9D6LSG0_9BACT|nr:class I SAM-dependent methyltransferase [Candidatus Sungbacteria bacterium]
MRKIIRRIANYFGYEVMRLAQSLNNQPRYLWLNDQKFHEIYQDSLKATHKGDFFPSKVRNYTLIQLASYVSQRFHNYPEQNFVEAGIARGTTLFQLCSVLKGGRHKIYAFDSFQGLSARTKEDVTSEFDIEKSLPASKIGSDGGRMAYSLEDVRESLKDFDFIEYHKGWIPDSFAHVPERQYLFVHVDLDLYQPTLAAFAYFYPRLVAGGVMVCDDYGFMSWPGAYKAVEEFSRRYHEPVIRLPTGQAVIIKQARPEQINSSVSAHRAFRAESQIQQPARSF